MFLNHVDYVAVYKDTVTESTKKKRIFIIDESEKKRQ